MHKSILMLAISCCSFCVLAEEESAPKAYEWANVLTLEAVDNLQGGVAQGTRSLANLDVTLTVDTHAAGWWDNGTWFVYALGDYGKNPSDLVGDVQGISNIAADNAAKIYEFWYQHHFVNDAVKLLVGLHDYNASFYSLDSAGLFNMPSFGIGPDTAQVTPSIFPTTSTAIQLNVEQDNFYAMLAVFDGVPGDPNNPHGTHIQFNKGDGVFKAAEFGLVEDKNYKIAIGGWQKSTEENNAVDGQLTNSNSGYYAIGEKNIDDDLRIFFQYGRADDLKNQLDEYIGAGVTLNNHWKENDALGLGYARARNGAPFLLQPENSQLGDAETIWELTYFMPLVEHLNAQTSLYYVENPGMSNSLDNAVALGARLYIEF